ncbi:MAG: hypothetical protein ACR2LK_00650, partial [Solirubrobacteraceae bacterium]
MSGRGPSLRVLAGSHGIDPSSLRAGHDVVLAMEPAHGLILASGVVAHDHLDAEARWAIYRTAVSGIAHARELLDEPLTVAGVCLPWIWEVEILVALTVLLGEAEGLRRCVRVSAPASLTLSSGVARHHRVAAAVAREAQIELHVLQPPGAERPAVAAGRWRPPPAGVVRR